VSKNLLEFVFNYVVLCAVTVDVSVVHSALPASMQTRQQLSHVQTVQQVICIIYCQPLLKSLHWLPITQRINFKLATLAFKIQSTSQPEYIRQLISSQHSGSSMTMTLRSSTRPLLHVQALRTRTAYGGRAFISAVPAIWNNLPTSVIEASSLPVFRRRLKTHLFTVAF